ncbi:hypothetical protein DPEC_G00301930 [Dallia pectoralis]|uniref:Uncharacterized protein n=1 Tax=Dallia pectoralis TaxID=75939 RepID=A0ACC2FGY5_DALPE|nr:hypothetical protein DPEC_G00301930 [Dallia pectoralis]
MNKAVPANSPAASLTTLRQRNAPLAKLAGYRFSEQKQTTKRAAATIKYEPRNERPRRLTVDLGISSKTPADFTGDIIRMSKSLQTPHSGCFISDG